jgi:hypothetical protein
VSDLLVALKSLALVGILAGCSSFPTASSSPEPSASPAVETIPPTTTSTPPGPTLPTPGPGLSSAPPAGWTEPVLISTRQLSYASLAIDDAGHVHLAVAAGEGATDRGVWYLTNKTGEWTETEVAQPPAEYEDGYDVEPSIAIDNGSVWIAFTRWPCRPLGCPSEGIFYVTNRNGAWTDPKLLAGPDFAGPNLAVHDGHIHLAYVQLCNFAPDDCNWPVHYGTDAGGSWRSMTALEDSSSGRALIDIDSTGSPRIMAAGWQGPASVEVARLTGDAFNVERVWQEDAVAHPTEAIPLLFATTTKGTDVAVWSCSCAKDGVFESVRSGGQWGDPAIVLPDVMGTAAVVDAGGILHVVGIDGAEVDTATYFYANSRSGFGSMRTLASEVGTDANGGYLFQYATVVAVDDAGRAHMAFIYAGSGREPGLWYVAGPVS